MKTSFCSNTVERSTRLTTSTIASCARNRFLLDLPNSKSKQNYLLNPDFQWHFFLSCSRHWKTCGTGGNLMKCEYCDKTVKDKFGMVNHIRRMHPDKAVGTVKAAGYFVHERVRVDGHWKYKCDICNKLIESNSRVFQ